ncbi:predicted protein [Chaetomium globosum CBS 148.51]|uniref:Uncharacterized protein n=1 Tax=Chaetomium globosum (strain ATCC 6205 / CBS 148.51 / DSM 1962 / NBRC 6347 / NRRL 1970) TaxID=306901 RepID=Q2H5Q7_CHAGB|nr:uncharacterized protein CHGG_06008 [Chaetomium globosum CBS 148.51]EAQ89389.1 predicted protein [Chaetomium globosum CBS 148.51]
MKWQAASFSGFLLASYGAYLVHLANFFEIHGRAGNNWLIRNGLPTLETDGPTHCTARAKPAPRARNDTTGYRDCDTTQRGGNQKIINNGLNDNGRPTKPLTARVLCREGTQFRGPQTVRSMGCGQAATNQIGYRHRKQSMCVRLSDGLVPIRFIQIDLTPPAQWYIPDRGTSALR